MKQPFRILAAVAAVTLAGCAADPSTLGELTIRNCGQDVTFPAPAQRMFVNDSTLISMVLALGAHKQVTAVSSLGSDIATLRKHYGPAADELNEVASQSPSREAVLAQRPDVVVAGWNYGFTESANLTPDTLRASGIAAYVLTESCRQRSGERPRGVVEPWTALREDLTNLGAITGRTQRAAELVADIDDRLAALAAAPKPERAPKIFLFDSASDTILSSGRFGGPQAILTAAGGQNVTEDVADTWTRVSWERLAAADPDAIMFVDYPPQTFAQKVELLRTKPGINQLRAVTESRFLNLPYPMWTSGPLNIDAAEQVRKQLERWSLVPPSDIEPRSDDAIR
ncbi:ABC transporter substrate-binding protein [Nocardia donostiensis]|uniref:Iron transporter n=1 Tax=Nocardia donostiensis TaxID=1538463 RepID=A0A1W0B9E4_9NOCA|nr:ABC transporter substrate-binding protein [Nocardia donostiensis]ONM46856.1 iron transporter [Nocardia donostiensis]OQS13205.1 iron transporter [Nocardia donostiensis]OQS19114.1 iron transporter [Nocardia donostiensis]